MTFKLSPDFTEALAFAAHLHVDQSRKVRSDQVRRIPYISHLLAVASLVIESGGDEDEAIAALLHDALEDQVGPHGNDVEQMRQRIRRRFGERVLQIVEGCSDSDGSDDRGAATWRARKEGYVRHIAAADASVLRVTTADKLHNARNTLSDLRLRGAAVWEMFNAGREEQLWYYNALTAALRQAGAPASLLDELERTVTQMAEV